MLLEDEICIFVIITKILKQTNKLSQNLCFWKYCNEWVSSVFGDLATFWPWSAGLLDFVSSPFGVGLLQVVQRNAPRANRETEFQGYIFRHPLIFNAVALLGVQSLSEDEGGSIFLLFGFFSWLFGRAKTKSREGKTVVI